MCTVGSLELYVVAIKCLAILSKTIWSQYC